MENILNDRQKLSSCWQRQNLKSSYPYENRITNVLKNLLDKKELSNEQIIQEIKPSGFKSCNYVWFS